MTFFFLRCFECCSTDLEEEYEGAPPTCKGCGVIGNVEKVPTPNDIADCLSICYVEENFRLHESMINFAKEIEDKKDLSDCMESLKIVRKKRFAPRYKPY
jgi:hypothetical protein